MESKSLDKVKNQVYRQFPEVAGSKPDVKPNSKAQSKSIRGGVTYQLTFKGKGANQRGQTIHRRVRVIATAKGKIIRISTSR